MSKKLLIRLSSAGDIILTSPLLKLIKEKEPDSEIHFVVKSIYSDLIQYNPNISTVHLVQENTDLVQLERLRQQLLGERFDSTLDLQNNFRSIYLRKGTSKRIGTIRKEIFKRAALVKMKLNLFREVRPVALKYAQVYDKTITQVSKPDIFFPPGMKEKTNEIWETLASRGDRTIFLCPGSKHFTKRWPVENWIALAKMISVQDHVVLIGGREDAEICGAIERAGGVSSLSGKLTMLESAAMLSHADLVITNDSFLMHAANALGKKIVAIFGSSVKELGFFPYGVETKIMEVSGLSCRPCSHIGKESCPKKHFRCMLGTTPQMVYEAATELLGI
ncbi:MAG TPA: glycosyltransferase family 9 protein [Candidatus Acidoferrales bacterium]|nr:glycosyltransferase family 9 protein [Candidatus Acidoferrales bacterium]